MKQNYLLTLIMCLLLSSSLWAQDARKLVADFDKKGSVKAANRFFDYLDQEQFTDERIQFATNTPTDSLRKEVWYWAGEWFNDTQEYGLARQYALRALPLYRHDNAAKGDCLNLLAIIGVRLADFPAAAQYATRCVRIYKKLRDPDQTSSALNTLAGINLAANHPRQAEKHILQALRYASRANNRPRQAVINGMASEIYYKLGNYQRSLQYAQKAYVIDSLLGNEGKMAVRLTMQGAALGGMKRDNEAVAVYQKAIPTLRSVGNIHSLGIALNQMGFILLRQKQEQAAVEAFREASGIFSKMGDLYNGCTARKGLYEAYWNLNPDSARHELERFNALRDSLYSTSTAKALARYEAEFGNDQLREEVSAGKNAHLRDLLISAAVLLLLIGLFLWLQRRRTRAHRAQLRQLFRELHRLESLSVPAAAETVVNPELTAHSSAADTEEDSATPIPSSQTTPSPDSVQPSVESSPADMADTLCRQVIEVVRSGMAKGEVSVTAVALSARRDSSPRCSSLPSRWTLPPACCFRIARAPWAKWHANVVLTRPVLSPTLSRRLTPVLRRSIARVLRRHKHIYIIRYNASQGSWLVFLKNVLQIVDDGLQALLYLWLLQIVDMLGRQGGEGVETTHLHHRGNG